MMTDAASTPLSSSLRLANENTSNDVNPLLNY
jgi:hypothetical protein